MAELQTTEIDGVPVVFTEEPNGPLVGALVFRVGQADEALTGRGHTHLIEHLALSRLTGTYRRSNGRVGMTVTLFDVEGEPEEVAGFFTDLAKGLQDLPVDRLETERRILRTEDARRGGSLGALAIGLRFGPQAYGVVDCPELGLPTATPEVLEAWSKRWFTKQNAALWLSGPPPEGLDLSALPDGERRPTPPLEPYPAYRYPAWYPGADTYVAVSMVAKRSAALSVAVSVLQERLYERLRTQEGRSYEVSVDYDPWTAGDVSVFVLTDTLPEQADDVREALSVELQRLARGGVTREELDDLREHRAKAPRDQRFWIAQAERQAFETLFGAKLETVEELERELAALDPSEPGAALREALGTALWLVPRDAPVGDRRIHALPGASDHVVGGQTYTRPPGVPDEMERDVLIVGPEGVSIQEPDLAPVTVTADACKALQGYDDGARVLWGADSIRLFVHPAMWQDGPAAITAIDEAIDPALRVPMGEPSGYDPPIDPEKARAKAAGGGLLGRLRRR